MKRKTREKCKICKEIFSESGGNFGATKKKVWIFSQRFFLFSSHKLSMRFIASKQIDLFCGKAIFSFN